ncbi:hypothetical protein CU669_00395 [Paramagnetospirillum kuznetsovii]|uniref:YfhO family protein n=1 Tax=Paramagnetospirillum kuznetsovii TaxID=2053833 RepID=A0A364P2R3_9PROT|nr:hypothetical protein [Paramagnetospirillum kuznetsovii]RAU23601.1 hypothetical protein CU669_00395 [Paramagnetospirillum kuznetsovii]
MNYTWDQILTNRILLLMAIMSMAMWPLFIWAGSRWRVGDWRIGQVRLFYWVWLAGFTAEFWIMGPYSFIAWDGEGNLAVAMNNYIAHFHPGGWFSHALAGGIDLALFFPGYQYLQPEVVFARLFPAWVAVALHKLMVGSLGFWGAWLLARQRLPERPGTAMAIALLFPVSQDYLLNYSTEFGTGFAMIPLALWVPLAAPRDHLFWPRALAVAVLVAFAQPMKVFPPLAIALVGAMILMGCRDFRRIVPVFGLYVLASLANWHEVLFGLFQGANFTTRIEMLEKHNALASLRIALAMVYQHEWVPGWQLLGALGCLAVLDRRSAVRVALALAWFVGSFAVLEATPWEAFGLDIVNTLSHSYNRLALPSLAALAVSMTLAALERQGYAVAGRRLTAGLFAAGVAVTVWIKLTNVGQWVWFGGQAAYTTHDNLINPPWKPSEDFRVVTLLDYPHPNVVAGFYGYDCFDAGSNLDPKAYGEFWHKVMRDRPDYFRTTRTRLDWAFWDGKLYHVGEFLRLDLLRLANVRFLFSGLPLTAEGLRLVQAPRSGDEYTRVRPDFFTSTGDFLRNRLSRLTNAGQLWVYEVENAVPRIFAAQSVAVAEGDQFSAMVEQAASRSAERVAVVSAAAARRLGPARPFKVVGWRKLPDGYDVDVEAPDGGVLVINNASFKFWTAEANGVRMPLEQANGAHMAVSLPPGAQLVKIRYDRPTVRGILRKLAIG